MSQVPILRRFGEAIDRRYLKKVGATSIIGSKYKLLLVCFHPFAAKKEIQFPNSITIKPDDPIGEFHLSNIRVTEIAAEPSERSLEWRLFEMLKADLGALATACVAGEIPADIQAFYGVNVLSAGAKRLGFTLVPIPKGWNRWWLGFWESMLRKIYYSYKTKKKASIQRTMDPFEIWITRTELISRYLKV